MSTRSPSCATATATSLAFLGLGLSCTSVSRVYLHKQQQRRKVLEGLVRKLKLEKPSAEQGMAPCQPNTEVPSPAPRPHLRSLSAHSAAISSAPLLLPLPTVTIVMGTALTERASEAHSRSPAGRTGLLEDSPHVCWAGVQAAGARLRGMHIYIQQCAAWLRVIGRVSCLPEAEFAVHGHHCTRSPPALSSREYNIVLIPLPPSKQNREPKALPPVLTLSRGPAPEEAVCCLCKPPRVA